MQKWEYYFVAWDRDGRGDYYPHSVNGRKIENWEHGTPLTDYIARLGGEGWELITASERILFFKRPKQ
jgi:hypothetical protein